MTRSQEPARLVLDAGRRFVLDVFGLGLACCAVELLATVAATRDLAGEVAPGQEPLHVLVVSGTVTDKIAPGVLRAYESTPAPRKVLSFGACANSGGPYWDSYCVTKGVDQLLPVDVWVPGCPPRPEALLEGLLALSEAAPATPAAAGSAPLLRVDGPLDLRRPL